MNYIKDIYNENQFANLFDGKVCIYLVAKNK